MVTKNRIAPKLTDAELLTLSVMQALLGFTSEARWFASRKVASVSSLSVSAKAVGL
jgi:hypothetical protein